MRLLHHNSFGTLTLTDFTGKSISPYAILSHRWGTDEVLYEHVAGGSYHDQLNGDGHRKIKFCGEQAAKDGLEYFRIDSCCINKHDRRERSRAINSMFKWYADAEKCYVYLVDVPSDQAPTKQDVLRWLSSKDEAHYSPQEAWWVTAFRASKWHERGWTLQELIAPRTVQFFTREGQLLGTKLELAQLLYEVSAVPIDVFLNHKQLEDYSIYYRITWGDSRKTKEPEDKVYCLLGILGVTLPLTYGEGEDKAMRRLLEATGIGSPPHTIPFSRNQQLVGRDVELTELMESLHDRREMTTLAVVGEGGTGKSQIALELAYRSRDRDKSYAVFWIDAGDNDSIHQGFSNTAEKLRLPGRDDPKVDIGQLVRSHLERDEAGRWLLIFNNVESMKYGSRLLTDCIPRSNLGAVLITTTERSVTDAIMCDVIIETHNMNILEAKDLLVGHAKNFSSSDIAVTERLLTKLSCLLLAIVQATAYMNISNTTAEEYLSLLRHEEDEVTFTDGGNSKVDENSLTSPVAATVNISLAYLERSTRAGPLAAMYLRLAACLDRKDIDLDLFGRVSAARDEAMTRLKELALITARPADGSIDLHRLVQAHLRRRLETENSFQKWVKNARRRLLEIFPSSQHFNRSRWRRLLPHTRYVLSFWGGEEDDPEQELEWQCAMAYSKDGRLEEAKELEVRVMDTMERLLGEDHPHTLISMANLASTYYDHGRWQDAEKLEIQVMEAMKRSLGGAHSHTLRCMNNLALTYSNQGRRAEAEALNQQVLETRIRTLGEEHPDTLTSMSSLASVYCAQGRWQNAEGLEERVMEAMKRVSGEEHPDTLTSMSNLALTYNIRGRCTEAEKLHKQVLETRQKILGDLHPATLTSMGNLASTYWKQGRYAEAETLQMQVLEVRRKSEVLGEEHPHTLASMSDLALTRKSLGQNDEALNLMVERHRLRGRTLGSTHPDYLATDRLLKKWSTSESIEVQQ